MLLVYVDDILLTGNNKTQKNNIIRQLNSKFALKDLGKIGYFLGFGVHSDSTNLYLTQKRYAQ